MTKRIYTSVFVSSHIYCSSSHHFFATVQPLGENGVFLAREYLINGQVILNGDNQIDRPKYLIEMIRSALRAKKDLRIFELDQDGVRRYEPLLYGSMGDLMEFIAK